jgi:neurabin
MQLQEYYLQHLQEKDTEYNALVKKLKDRVICLEQELQETQRTAGLPVELPYDNTSLKLTPQMSRKQPPKPMFQKLETDFSDLEISDLSPDGDGDAEDEKTATVERKLPAKEELDLDAAVPRNELLDSSLNKGKSDLVSRGALANRQLPSVKKSNSTTSSSCTLDEEDEHQADATNNNPSITNGVHYSTPQIQKVQVQQVTLQSQQVPLYAQVHKDRNEPSLGFTKIYSTIPNTFRTQVPTDVTGKNTSYGSDLNASSYDSDLGSSNDKLDDGSDRDNWMYPSRRPKGLKGITPPSLAEQLKERLAKREGRRLTEEGSSRDSSDDYSEINRGQSPASVISQNLLSEIKKAVNEAQPKGNFSILHI